MLKIILLLSIACWAVVAVPISQQDAVIQAGMSGGPGMMPVESSLAAHGTMDADYVDPKSYTDLPVAAIKAVHQRQRRFAHNTETTDVTSEPNATSEEHRYRHRRSANYNQLVLLHSINDNDSSPSSASKETQQQQQQQRQKRAVPPASQSESDSASHETH